MKRFHLTFLLLAVLVGLFLPSTANAEDVAEKVPHTIVPKVHQGNRFGWHNRVRIRFEQGNVDLLFVCDSVISQWDEKSFASLRFFYYDRPYAVMGAHSDRTQNSLWWLDNAPVDKIQPKVVVLQNGHNNLLLEKDSPEDVALGIQACVDKLQALYPKAKILVLDLFIVVEPNDPVRQQIIATNAKMRELLKNHKNVRILDFSDLFLNEKGEVSKEFVVLNKYYYFDLTGKGYSLLGNRLDPVIAEILGVKAKELKPTTL